MLAVFVRCALWHHPAEPSQPQTATRECTRRPTGRVMGVHGAVAGAVRPSVLCPKLLSALWLVSFTPALFWIAPVVLAAPVPAALVAPSTTTTNKHDATSRPCEGAPACRGARRRRRRFAVLQRWSDGTICPISKMRLLTHNLLMCNKRGCTIEHFPLKIVPTKIAVEASDFNPAEVRAMFGKLEWSALVSAAKDVCSCSTPPPTTEAGATTKESQHVHTNSAAKQSPASHQQRSSSQTRRT